MNSKKADVYAQHLLTLPDEQFRLECIRWQMRARRCHGRAKNIALANEECCARAAARRPGGIAQWHRAMETVRDALAIKVLDRRYTRAI